MNYVWPDSCKLLAHIYYLMMTIIVVNYIFCYYLLLDLLKKPGTQSKICTNYNYGQSKVLCLKDNDNYLYCQFTLYYTFIYLYFTSTYPTHPYEGDRERERERDRDWVGNLITHQVHLSETCTRKIHIYTNFQQA